MKFKSMLLISVLALGVIALIAKFDSTMSRVKVTDFWPEVRDDLTKVTWAHAVNSKSLLKSALNDGKRPELLSKNNFDNVQLSSVSADHIMMMEADVNVGHLIDQPSTSDPMPIMAHPPAVVSDLSLKAFVHTVSNVSYSYYLLFHICIYCNNFLLKQAENVKKGIKLDFKSLSIVEPSLKTLSKDSKKVITDYNP